MITRVVLAVFAIVSLALSGCSIPFIDKESTSTQPTQPVPESTRTPIETPYNIPEIEVKQEISKFFDSEFKRALKEVFGDAKLVDAIESEDFIYLSYDLPREVRSGDLKAVLNVLKYEVVDILDDESDVVLGKSVNGKTYHIHVMLFGESVEVEVESI